MPNSAHEEPKYIDHANKIKTMPTYMGFLDKPNTPDTTNDVADCGFNGLTVVFTLRNAMSADTEKYVPANQQTRIPIILDVPIGSFVPEDTSHITAPKNNATTGGGILLSIFMLLTYVA